MKRQTYVDEEGNPINQSLENKKPLLRFFFVFGTILPIIILINRCLLNLIKINWKTVKANKIGNNTFATSKKYSGKLWTNNRAKSLVSFTLGIIDEV